MSEHSENAQFARLIVALEPWLTQVVIIGGWAHRLYTLAAVERLTATDSANSTGTTTSTGTSQQNQTEAERVQ